MTHPVLSDRRRLLVYLAMWLPGGALLGTLLVLVGNLAWLPALALAIPLALFYAFVCLAAWYPSRQTPLAAGRFALAATKHLAAAALSSALGQLAGGGLATLLARLPGPLAGQFEAVDDVFRQQVPLLFAVGMLVYLLAVAASYLVIAVETGRLTEKRALEAEQVQALAARELELARAIQQRLLPPPVHTGDLWQLAARNLAAQFVAGDFYDYFRLPDGSLMLAIGDVSGKGIAASLVTATVKAVLPLLAAERSVAATLARLNERLCQELTRRTFVALSLAHYQPASGRLDVVNAGLPDPYLLRDGQPARPIEAPQPRLPLGLRRGIEYAVVSTDLEPGDRLLMITDGLPEAPLGDGDPFGYERLAAELVRPAAAPAIWLDGLFDRLRGLTAPELADDWTAIVLERTGSAAVREP